MKTKFNSILTLGLLFISASKAEINSESTTHKFFEIEKISEGTHDVAKGALVAATSGTTVVNMKSQAQLSCESKSSYTTTEKRSYQFSSSRECVDTTTYNNDYYWNGKSCSIKKTKINTTTQCVSGNN